MIVVSDSTVLIGLVKVDQLSLLHKLFATIMIPQEVFNEVVLNAPHKPGVMTVKTCDWIQNRAVSNDKNCVCVVLRRRQCVQVMKSP